MHFSGGDIDLVSSVSVWWVRGTKIGSASEYMLLRARIHLFKQRRYWISYAYLYLGFKSMHFRLLFPCVLWFLALSKIASKFSLTSLNIEKQTFIQRMMLSRPTNQKMHTLQGAIFLCKNKVDPFESFTLQSIHASHLSCWIRLFCMKNAYNRSKKRI